MEVRGCCSSNFGPQAVMDWLEKYGHLIVIVQISGLYALYSVDRFKLKLVWRWYEKVHGMNGKKQEGG